MKKIINFIKNLFKKEEDEHSKNWGIGS